MKKRVALARAIISDGTPGHSEEEVSDSLSSSFHLFFAYAHVTYRSIQDQYVDVNDRRSLGIKFFGRYLGGSLKKEDSMLLNCKGWCGCSWYCMMSLRQDWIQLPLQWLRI